MKILEINSIAYGSTGHIMLNLADMAKQKGHQVMMLCPNTRSNRRTKSSVVTLFGNNILNYLGRKLSYFSGYSNCFCYINTRILINKIIAFEPDLIHFHNLHPDYVNLPMLSGFIKKQKIPIVWTLHDCWAFTGGCPHYTIAKCQKWKTGCNLCPQFRQYPERLFDTSRRMYFLKKGWFGGFDYLTIVTPSRWLAEQVRESFLNQYKIDVIYNGIDVDIFIKRNSNFRNKYDCKNKKIILGVSYVWDYKKGFDVFVELSRVLPSNYQIVLVGVDDNIKKNVPENVLSIFRTESQKELSEIYSAADVFVNPTREEVLGMVNIEALSCGTPVVTFDTGGSPECVDETCGVVVPVDDVTAMKKAIIDVCENRNIRPSDCRKRALDFRNESVYSKYVDLYESFFVNK